MFNHIKRVKLVRETIILRIVMVIGTGLRSAHRCVDVVRTIQDLTQQYGREKPGVAFSYGERQEGRAYSVGVYEHVPQACAERVPTHPYTPTGGNAWRAIKVPYPHQKILSKIKIGHPRLCK